MPFNRLNHNILGEIRPRFSLKIACEPEVALEHVKKRMLEDKTVSGERSLSLLFIKTPSWLQHYWSPEMTARIEVEEFTDYTSVSCLVGPRQSVWALFVFFYSIIGIATLFAIMFGYIRYTQFDSPALLYCSSIGVLLLLSVFITSKFGQRKGRDQMLHLISFLYHSLDEITEVERIDD